MSKDLVRAYYASFHEREWERLDRPEGIIEFAVVTDALGRHLRPRERILDIGGGPGRYAIWLAKQGHSIVLADLSPNLLQIAREKIREANVQDRIEDVLTIDACDLGSFADASFDSVLCLGPFYHMVVESDRDRAARELIRVLRPGGLAFIAFMPIYAFLGRTLGLKDEVSHLADAEFVSKLMNEGTFINDVPGRFNSGYGVDPLQVAQFFEDRGLKTVELLSDTGFAAPFAANLLELADANPEAYSKAMELVIRSASDPSILGSAVHLVYVAQKGQT